MGRSSRTLLIVLLSLVLSLGSGAALAGDVGSGTPPEEPRYALGVSEPPGTGRKLYDAVVLRPFGLFQTVLGSVAFLVFYPMALPFGGGDVVLDVCITKPVDRTFRRPLGEL